MGKFHSYSFNNTILIQMQIPNASYLAGYKTWETLERHVKKGERGIMILAPNQYKRMKEVEVFDPITGKQKVDADGNPVTEQKEITYATFRPIAIFDISQTEGKPLPELAQELHGDIKNYGMILDAVKNTTSVPITFESWEGSKKGYYNFVEQRIGIKEGMSELQTVKTAIHELTHSVLHTDKDKLKDAATMEVEAESVAFGPVFCPEVRLRGRRYDRQRLRAAGAFVRRNHSAIRTQCEKTAYRKSDADRLLRYAVPLYPRQSGNDKTTLRSARCPGGFHRGGYAPQGQGAALRIQ